MSRSTPNRFFFSSAQRGRRGLLHDKAFEIGLFTLDEHFRVFVNPKECASSSAMVQNLIGRQGEAIRSAQVLPLPDALLEHWIRVDIDPMVG